MKRKHPRTTPKPPTAMLPLPFHLPAKTTHSCAEMLALHHSLFHPRLGCCNHPQLIGGGFQWGKLSAFNQLKRVVQFLSTKRGERLSSGAGLSRQAFESDFKPERVLCFNIYTVLQKK